MRLCVGQVFADYTIDGILGQGGMGSVYLARHPRLPRQVALKLLAPEVSADDALRRRFDQEANAIARLDHPNIVGIHDRGVHEGQLWIAMQYIQGTDTSRLDPRQVRVTRAVRIIAETAAALDYAHSRGILHRDVKPANILLAAPDTAREERAILTDFGIARLLDAATEITSTGMVTATLAYASPEQLSGDRVDHRSDQYSLACTFFALLTGQPPFAGSTPGQVIAGHLTKPFPLLSSIRLDSSPQLDMVIARATAKSREARFASCTEFAMAAAASLHSPVGTGLSLTSAPQPMSTARPFAPEPVDPRPALRSAAPTADANAPKSHAFGRRRLLTIGAVAVPLAVAGVAVPFALHDSGAQPSKPTPSANPAPTPVVLQASDPVTRLAFTPDGSTLAVGVSPSGPVDLWDTKNHTEIREIKGNSDVVGLAFSPDGKTMVTGRFSRCLQFFDPTTGAQIGDLVPDPEMSMSMIAISPDGAMVAVAGDAGIRLWDMRTRQRIGQIDGFIGSTDLVAFTPDSAQVVTLQASAQVYDVRTGARIRMMTPPAGVQSRTMAFSPDGTTIAVGGSDGMVRLWDPKSGQQIGEMSDSVREVPVMTFSPDSRTLAAAHNYGSGDWGITLWDVSKRTRRGYPWFIHSGSVNTLAFSPDGSTLASGGDDQKVRLWDTSGIR
ncbi:WD40 repeat domain-containing serine/threonine protein kinase [Nocardia sp. NBC_00511]|uniref:WD40 repeat domain-containing serine/threonine protein kinase n=1 Tax=Nocardia sp. NBC_00511 TaxID=2903591 RepID=UPI0030E2C4F1